MEAIMNYVKPELLVLIPVLYFIGASCKKSQHVSDAVIPLVLGGCGVVLVLLWQLGTSSVSSAQDFATMAFTGIVQGILVAGASVYFNQIGKQAQKLHEGAENAEED